MEQWLARESHNLKVGGSSPPPATKWVCRNQGDRVTGGDPVAHTSSSLVRSTIYGCLIAGVAQRVEQLICNQQVVGSKPSTGSNLFNGRVVEVVYNAGLSRRWSGFESPYARYKAYRRLLEYHFYRVIATGSIVQWIERRSSKPLIQVRFLLELQNNGSIVQWIERRFPKPLI